MIRLFHDVKIDWLGKRRFFIGLSILLMLAGMGTAPVHLPGLVGMELIQGCRNSAEQQRLERMLQRFAKYSKRLARRTSDCSGMRTTLTSMVRKTRRSQSVYLENTFGIPI